MDSDQFTESSDYVPIRKNTQDLISKRRVNFLPLHHDRQSIQSNEGPNHLPSNPCQSKEMAHPLPSFPGNHASFSANDRPIDSPERTEYPSKQKLQPGCSTRHYVWTPHHYKSREMKPHCLVHRYQEPCTTRACSAHAAWIIMGQRYKERNAICL